MSKKKTKSKNDRNTIDDWKVSSDRRRISTRHTLEEMIFLERFAGYGRRATLLRWLLREYMQEHKTLEFEQIIIKQKELEELKAARTA